MTAPDPPTFVDDEPQFTVATDEASHNQENQEESMMMPTMMMTTTKRVAPTVLVLVASTDARHGSLKISII